MTQPRLKRRSMLPRLIRINLPGMKIKDAREPLLAIDTAHRPPRYPIGQEAEIAPAGTGEVAAKETHGRKRNLDQTRILIAEGRPRAIRHPVEIMPDRIDARTIGMSRLCQNLECPPVSRTDRERCSAISANRYAAGVLEDRLRHRDVFTKFRARLRIGTPMAISVTCKLVAFGHDTADEARMTFGDPAQGEKGRSDAVVGKEIQEVFGISFDPT